MSKHPLFRMHKCMMQRCHKESTRAFYLYGARGIQVCPAWRDFRVFVSEVMRLLGPCPPGCSIDRINNDGNYEPGNVRWATPSAQQRNTRMTKLTEAKVAELKKLRSCGWTIKSLASRYGVSMATVGSVLSGRTWKDVQPAA